MHVHVPLMHTSSSLDGKLGRSLAIRGFCDPRCLELNMGRPMEPQTGTPGIFLYKHTLVLIFLLYSNCILGAPYLERPSRSLYGMQVALLVSFTRCSRLWVPATRLRTGTAFSFGCPQFGSLCITWSPQVSKINSLLCSCLMPFGPSYCVEYFCPGLGEYKLLWQFPVRMISFLSCCQRFCQT